MTKKRKRYRKHLIKKGNTQLRKSDKSPFFRTSQYFNLAKDLHIPEKKHIIGTCPSPFGNSPFSVMLLDLGSLVGSPRERRHCTEHWLNTAPATCHSLSRRVSFWPDPLVLLFVLCPHLNIFSQSRHLKILWGNMKIFTYSK